MKLGDHAKVLLQSKGQKTFSVEGHIVIILVVQAIRFVPATTLLYYCRAKIAVDNIQTNEDGCVPIEICLQK